MAFGLIFVNVREHINPSLYKNGKLMLTCHSGFIFPIAVSEWPYFMFEVSGKGTMLPNLS